MIAGKPEVPSSYTADEGVQFGALIAGVFILLFFVEYARVLRGKKKGIEQEQYANAATWCIFLILTAAGHVHKPNDPSILITAGEGMQLFTMFLIWAAPRRGCNQNVPRASVEFGALMLFSMMIRIWCTMKFEGYLPVDRTGDGCIQFIELGSFLLTLYGLWNLKLKADQTPRVVGAIVIACSFARVCYGNLDNDAMADRLYATSVYSEFLAWVFLLQYARNEGKDGVCSMALLPAFVQAACKAYFWYAAFNETSVKKPILLQGIFNIVLLMDYVVLCLLLMYMSTVIIKVVPKIDLIPSNLWRELDV